MEIPRRVFLVSLPLVGLVACDKNDDGTPEGPTGPTPGGKPMATSGLVLTFSPRPNNAFAVVIGATDKELRNAIMVDIWFFQRPLQAGESWSGSLLWLVDHTDGNLPIATSIPFVPGQTDRFSFSSVSTGGRVDFSLEWQPGGSKRRMKTVLNGNLMQANGDYRIDEIAGVYRVRGSLPR